jgi:chemotaxis protein CheZ
MREIEEIRKSIETITQPGGVAPEEGPRAGSDGAAAIRHELKRLRDAIEDTKKEIAAIRHPAAKSDPILTATDQLDAVVEATEGATNTILETVEKIDELTQRARHSTSEKHTSELLGEVSDMVATIFEACNFQDITGQRITKVVNTMKFIEERMNTIVGIWGTEAFGDIQVPEVEEPALDGPQRGDGGISQDDIDKLFD